MHYLIYKSPSSKVHYYVPACESARRIFKSDPVHEFEADDDPAAAAYLRKWEEEQKAREAH